jgi:hypothetical protein
VFKEGPKTILDKSFTLTPAASSKTKRAFSSLFEGNDPAVVVQYATDYQPQSVTSGLGGNKGKSAGFGGWLDKAAGAAGVGLSFANPSAIQLLINDTPIANWSAENSANNTETRQSMEIGGVPVNVTIQTQHVTATRTPQGKNQLSSVAVKVLIERLTP